MAVKYHRLLLLLLLLLLCLARCHGPGCWNRVSNNTRGRKLALFKLCPPKHQSRCGQFALMNTHLTAEQTVLWNKQKQGHKNVPLLINTSSTLSQETQKLYLCLRTQHFADVYFTIYFNEQSGSSKQKAVCHQLSVRFSVDLLHKNKKKIKRGIK